jgi:hypothetical protein
MGRFATTNWLNLSISALLINLVMNLAILMKTTAQVSNRRGSGFPVHSRPLVMDAFRKTLDLYIQLGGGTPTPDFQVDSLIPWLAGNLFDANARVFDEMIPVRVKAQDSLWYFTSDYTQKHVKTYFQDLTIHFPQGLVRKIQNGNWNFSAWPKGKSIVRLARNTLGLDTAGHFFESRDTVDVVLTFYPESGRAKISQIALVPGTRPSFQSNFPKKRFSCPDDWDCDGRLNEEDPSPLHFSPKKNKKPRSR